MLALLAAPLSFVAPLAPVSAAPRSAVVMQGYMTPPVEYERDYFQDGPVGDYFEGDHGYGRGRGYERGHRYGRGDWDRGYDREYDRGYYNEDRHFDDERYFEDDRRHGIFSNFLRRGRGMDNRRQSGRYGDRWGMDRGMDRGMERGMDRGMERGMMDRGMERGYRGGGRDYWNDRDYHGAPDRVRDAHMRRERRFSW